MWRFYVCNCRIAPMSPRKWMLETFSFYKIKIEAESRILYRLNLFFHYFAFSVLFLFFGEYCFVSCLRTAINLMSEIFYHVLFSVDFDKQIRSSFWIMHKLKLNIWKIVCSIEAVWTMYLILFYMEVVNVLHSEKIDVEPWSSHL